MLEFNDNNYTHVMLHGAHGLGVNSVCWGPAAKGGSLVSAAPVDKPGRRFVSGGSDCLVKIWEWKYVSSYNCLISVSETELMNKKSRTKNLHNHAHPPWSHRLGPRRLLVPQHSLRILHRIRLPGQNRPDLDLRSSSSRPFPIPRPSRMEMYSVEF